MTDKENKIFKCIIIALITILVVELLYFGIKVYTTRKNNVFNTFVNSAILEDSKNYIGAGLSDFRYSKFNEFDKGYDKATIFVVKNGKIKKEIAFQKGFNSRFNDIVKVSDGYVAVGKIEMTKDQIKEKMNEGLIVKYNKDFKVVWRKNVSILENTELLKVKTDGDDIVVVGGSIYSEGYVGNHSTGGGILLKYDKSGKELLRVNYGGPYKGKFNDLIVEKDSYVVVGLGKSNSGIIISYDKSGKKKWSGSYGYTDSNGINSVVKKGDNYITATTKVVNTKDLSNYSAALVVFNSKGEKIDDAKYSDNKINYFSDVEVDKDGNIYACGYTGKVIGNDSLTDAIIVKYDKDLYEKKANVLKGSKKEVYSNIYINNDTIYALGYTNSKIKKYNTNGYDFFPIIKKYNMNLK